MAWVSVVLVAMFLAVAALHGLRVPALRGAQALDEALFALMALGMAAMFLPGRGPVPPAAWIVVFTAAAVWSAASLVRGRPGGEPGHLLVGSVAMVFMLVVGHGSGSVGTAAAALVLAGCCAWHAARHAEQLGAAGGMRALRGAHVVMPVAMAVMVLGAL